MQTIVIGHRNPDMDSICSAIAYAELKRKLGLTGVIAARAGNTNERIDFVLNKFGVAAPEFVSDLTPTVGDVMETKVVSVQNDATVFQALTSIEQKRLRGLPVINLDGCLLGLLSGWKISHYLFPPREETASARVIRASIANILQALDGRVLAGSADGTLCNLVVMVAAMSPETFSERLKRRDGDKIVVFVGDREDVQLTAIQNRVVAVVVTGGFGVSVRVREAAKEAGVCLISSRFDTATSIMSARGAVPVEQMIDQNFTSFRPETRLRAARHTAADSLDFVFPVVDKDNRLIGILSKSDFLRPVPRQLILVDHNELTQAVRGANENTIIEVLDHHRLASFSTDSPILFWNNPVGSTSTIVALCYRQYGVPIDPPIAGLLMAGLISDTLNLTSPTATEVDAQVLKETSQIAGVTPSRLAEEIFAVGSPLRSLAPEAAILADCKDYDEGGFRFSVAQVEELSFAPFEAKQAELFSALQKYREDQKTYFSAFLVTDVNMQNSRMLIAAFPEFLEVIHYPRLGPNLFELNNVVSRKKQLVPYLLDCLQRVTPSIS
jgi:manganese-dependent inorganic pyrophosphatase